MSKTAFILVSFIAFAYCQTCPPEKQTAPCGDGMPCQTGLVCDTVAGSCCLQSDAVGGTTVPGQVTVTGTGTTVSTTRSGVVTRVTSSGSCVDKVNPATGVSDCAARASLCNDAAYVTIMTQQCPKTCGKCTSTTGTSGSCVDLINPQTGRSDCSSLSRLCNDSNYQTLMRTQCPKTCGFCTSSGVTGTTISSSRTSTISSGTCADQVNPSTGTSDCARNQGLCNNSQYQSLMRTQCPRTCGFC